MDWRLTCQPRGCPHIARPGSAISERTAALNYYRGDVEADIPSIVGRSKATSSDVADTIEGLMPNLMEIFAGSDDAVMVASLLHAAAADMVVMVADITGGKDYAYGGGTGGFTPKTVQAEARRMRTLLPTLGTSALGGKADISVPRSNVR